MRLILPPRNLLVVTLALGLAALLGEGVCPRTAWGQDELFVANAGTSTITVYRRTASGNIAPTRTLAGPATGLRNPGGLVVDTVNNELVVLNGGDGVQDFGPPSVTVYPRTASGNVAPIRTLAGAATGLNRAGPLVVDTVNNELMVTNNDSVLVYPRTASGNIAPIRTLAGPATGLNSPGGLVVDTVNNELVVVNFGNDVNTGNSSVTVYPRTASGNIAPTRTLAGPATGLRFPLGLVVDTVNNELVVANAATPSSVTVYPRTASGNTGPTRTLAGAATGLSSPAFIAVTPVKASVVGDFDGDGKADLAIYRKATGEWFIFGSTTGLQTGTFGAPASSGLGDTPVPADFDGDGKTDLAIYRQATAEWFIFGSATGFQTRVFGAPASSGLGDTPVP